MLKRLWRENRGFIVFITLMLVMRSSVADWYHVPTGSMQPNIVEGDRIFVDKMAYRLDIPFTDIAIAHYDMPKRGEVVVFDSESADNRLVKRVIGVPGDVVAMRNNRLFVNGNVAQYQGVSDYVYTEQLGELSRQIQVLPVSSPFSSFEPVTVPDGHLLVLGDNRNNSSDSRYYGFVPVSEVSGRATKVIASLDPDNYYIPRTDRFLQSL